jgi:hypothetical protein
LAVEQCSISALELESHTPKWMTVLKHAGQRECW